MLWGGRLIAAVAKSKGTRECSGSKGRSSEQSTAKEGSSVQASVCGYRWKAMSFRESATWRKVLRVALEVRNLRGRIDKEERKGCTGWRMDFDP